MDKDRFALVGIRPPDPSPPAGAGRCGRPVISGILLCAIALGCLCCELFIPGVPGYMDLANCNAPPSGRFWFGTDAMGQDIFSAVWYGGRVSLFIGFASALISTAAAILFGSASGLAPRWLDALLMRAADILLSVPGLLLMVLIQAALGEATPLSLAFVTGITGWAGMAKVVRAEVRQLRSSGFVLASRCMGGGFFHILTKHLTPNFLSSIMFMAVMNVRSAIAAESTLSFMGLGLPLETVSWGSMLSLSQRGLLSGSWWIVLIPGAFLVGTLYCVTDIGDYLRKRAGHRQSNL